ncbi:molybdopterin molybdotransferase MoeA, partial [Agromyces soli]
MTAEELEPIEAHLHRVLEIVRPVEPSRLPLREAAGLVLAESVASRLDVPRFDGSAMDGYAVRHADVAAAAAEAPVELRVIAEVAAGSPLDPPIAPGEAVSIMTGAPMPSDADTVVRLEHTDRGTARVRIFAAPVPGAHVRRRGEELAAGAPLLEAGVRLDPYRLATAAAAGWAELAVRRAPRVAIVSTGSELREPGSALGRGEIPESNSLLLAGLAAGAGADVVSAGWAPDDPAALRAEIDGCLAGDVDLVVLSGGVSVGGGPVGGPPPGPPGGGGAPPHRGAPRQTPAQRAQRARNP